MAAAEEGTAQVVVEEDERQWLQGLSWTSRVQGYLLFTALGFFSTAMSWVSLGMGYYWKYSILSTLGSLMSLVSTFIIMGPQAQLSYMFDEYRALPSICYICSLLFTFIVAAVYKSVLLCAFCGIIQYGCLIWYSLSYVPYGYDALKLLFRSFF